MKSVARQPMPFKQRHAGKLTPDIMTLDIIMPKLDGISFLKG